jgi:hypothetical protein
MVTSTFSVEIASTCLAASPHSFCDHLPVSTGDWSKTRMVEPVALGVTFCKGRGAHPVESIDLALDSRPPAVGWRRTTRRRLRGGARGGRCGFGTARPTRGRARLGLLKQSIKTRANLVTHQPDALRHKTPARFIRKLPQHPQFDLWMPPHSTVPPPHFATTSLWKRGWSQKRRNEQVAA